MRRDDHLSLYLTSLSMIVIPFMAYLLFLGADEPPPFPLPVYYDPIDCYSIIPVSMEGEYARIKTRFIVGNFIEFEPNTALRLMHVVTQTGDIAMDHKYPQFWDVEIDWPNISFAVLHPIVGKTKGVLMCHGREIAQLEYNVTLIDRFSVGASRTVSDTRVLAIMNNVCYSNNTIRFFAHPLASASALRVAYDYAIPYDIYYIPASSFQRAMPTHETADLPTVFVSAAPVYGWQHLTDVVIPLWNLLGGPQTEQTIRIYLTRNQVNLIKNIEKIMPGDVFLNTTDLCLDTAVFLKAPGGVPLDVPANGNTVTSQQAIAEHLASLTESDPWIISKLRGCFTKATVTTGMIVLDQYMARLSPRLQNSFPGVNIEIVPDTDDLATIADCVGSAVVYIAGHVTTLVYSIFLQPGALVVEVQPDGFGCTTFGRDWARLAQVGYLPIRNGTCAKCNSTDLFCYLNEDIRHSEVPQQDLKDGILKAFNII
jgi:hypothetical protein